MKNLLIYLALASAVLALCASCKTTKPKTSAKANQNQLFL